MIFFYKNSFLASLVSITACGLIMCALALFGDGEILPGIIFLVAGIPLFIWAKQISLNKADKKWWKELEKKGVIAQAATNQELAISIYKKNPTKQTLKNIRKINPAAADVIENKAPAAPAPQPAPKAVPQSTPKAVPQAAPQSVPKAAPQAAPRPAPQAAPSGPESAMQEALRLSAGNTNRDPQVYLQCVQKLEELYRTNPLLSGLRQNLAKAHTDYAASIQEPVYADRKRAAESALRALELEPEASQDKQDKRVFQLYLNALIMSIVAGNSTGTRAQMVESHDMLRHTARYYIHTPDEIGKLLMGISIPAARCRIAYCLARNLARTEPTQPQQAAAMAQEALRFCPTDTIRQCDLNPYSTGKTTVLLTRQDIQNLINQLHG